MARVSRAFVLFALLLAAGGCGNRYMREWVRSTAALEPVQCVAVFPLDNLTSYPNAGLIMADFIATDLYATGMFRVMERTEVVQQAAAVNLPLPPRMNAEFARALGEKLNVDGVIYGSVSEYWYPNTTGTDFSEHLLQGDEPTVGMNVRLLDVASGEIVWSNSMSRTSFAVFTSQRDPLSRVAQLAVREMIEPMEAKLGRREVNPNAVCGQQIAPMRGAFIVKVLDSKTGKTVPDASVRLKKPVDQAFEFDPALSTYASPQLEPGLAQYVVTAEGYEPKSESIEVVSNKVQQIDLRLTPVVKEEAPPELKAPSVFRARVKNPEGAALAGAIVVLDPPDPEGAMVADAAGKVERRIAPGSYLAISSAMNYQRREMPFRIDEGQVQDLEIVLQPVVVDLGPVRVEPDRLAIDDKIRFKAGKTEIEQSSYELLTQVAQTIKNHPEIKKIQVEGHTDDRGGAIENQRLSEKRAQKVVEFLVSAGVEAGRLSAVGFGEAIPIAENSTAEGRETNRRVEFVIVEK